MKVAPDEARRVLEGFLQTADDVALATLVNEYFTAEEGYSASIFVDDSNEIIRRSDRLYGIRVRLSAFFMSPFRKKRARLVAAEPKPAREVVGYRVRDASGDYVVPVAVGDWDWVLSGMSDTPRPAPIPRAEAVKTMKLAGADLDGRCLYLMCVTRPAKGD